MQGEVSRTRGTGTIHCLSTHTWPVSEHAPVRKRHVLDSRHTLVVHSSKLSQSESLLQLGGIGLLIGLFVGPSVGLIVGLPVGLDVG